MKGERKKDIGEHSNLGTTVAPRVSFKVLFWAILIQFTKNKLHEFAASSQKTQKMLTPKHSGFVHTILLISQSNLLIVYNCPPPKSLLGVQLTGQRGTIPCI